MTFYNLPSSNSTVLPAPPEITKSPQSELMGRPGAAAKLRRASLRVGAPRLAGLCPAVMTTGVCTGVTPGVGQAFRPGIAAACTSCSPGPRPALDPGLIITAYNRAARISPPISAMTTA